LSINDLRGVKDADQEETQR